MWPEISLESTWEAFNDTETFGYKPRAFAGLCLSEVSRPTVLQHLDASRPGLECTWVAFQETRAFEQPLHSPALGCARSPLWTTLTCILAVIRRRTREVTGDVLPETGQALRVTGARWMTCSEESRSCLLAVAMIPRCARARRHEISCKETPSQV